MVVVVVGRRRRALSFRKENQGETSQGEGGGGADLGRCAVLRSAGWVLCRAVSTSFRVLWLAP